MRLQNAHILIVGGGSGIGFAVAEAALAEGAKITIASTDIVKLELAAKKLGNAAFQQLDVTEEDTLARYFDGSGDFDHIVSTAGDWGRARRGAFTDMELSDAKDLFGVRFWGAAALAKHGARRLADGGSFTFTGGTTAYKPKKGTVMATAMAGSVAHLTYGLAAELAPIRVNAVFPGGVATEIYQNLPEAVRRSEEARFEQQLLPRVGQASEVAEAYLYLMKAGYTTGQVLVVDGGGVVGG